MQPADQQKHSTRPPSTKVNGPMSGFRRDRLPQDVARVKSKELQWKKKKKKRYVCQLNFETKSCELFQLFLTFLININLFLFPVK